MTEPAALAGVESGTVMWRVLAAAQDTNDPDRQPNFGSFRGNVLFRPSIPWVRRLDLDPTNSYTVFLDDVIGTVGDDGILRDLSGLEGVVLVSPFATGIEETGWTWEASFELNQRQKVSFPFQFVPDEVVDLSRVTPIVQTPTQIITKGDPGEPGPAGPGVPAGGADNDVIVHNGLTTEWQPSTSLPDVDTVMRRDAAGRARVAAPLNTSDIARLDTVQAAEASAKDRANHTGTQASATLSDLTETVQDIVDALLQAGTGVTKNYNDTTGVLTLSVSGSGEPTDPEIVRDVIGTALVAGSGIQITVNDVGDTITIASTAVLPTRQVNAGPGLTGGGDLSANRTLSVLFGAAAETATEGNDPRLSDARTPTAHTHPVSEISDKSTLGATLMQVADGPAARTAIGAGTSNLTLGSTSTTAAPGDHGHTPAQVNAVEAVTANLKMRVMTQSAYDGLGTKDATTLYIIQG